MDSEIGLSMLDDHHPKRTCPVCNRSEEIYLFTRHGRPVLRCAHCGLTRAGDEPAGGGLEAADPAESESPPSLGERKTVEAALAALEARSAPVSGMLVVCTDGHPFLAAAAGRRRSAAGRAGIEDV